MTVAKLLPLDFSVRFLSRKEGDRCRNGYGKGPKWRWEGKIVCFWNGKGNVQNIPRFDNQAPPRPNRARRHQGHILSEGEFFRWARKVGNAR